MKQFTLDEIHKQILMELFFALVLTITVAIPLGEMYCLVKVCGNHFKGDLEKAEDMLSHVRHNLCEYQPLYECDSRAIRCEGAFDELLHGCRGDAVIRNRLLEQVREDKKEEKNGLKDNVCRTLREWKLVASEHPMD